MSENVQGLIWNTSTPPNEELVEVEDDEGEIIEVMAYYGRDGCRPHWRTADGSSQWSPTAFSRWRRKETHCLTS